MQTGVTIADMTALYEHYRTKDAQTNEDQRRLKRIEELLNKLTDGLKENPVKDQRDSQRDSQRESDQRQAIKWGE